MKRILENFFSNMGEGVTFLRLLEKDMGLFEKLNFKRKQLINEWS